MLHINMMIINVKATLLTRSKLPEACVCVCVNWFVILYKEIYLGINSEVSKIDCFKLILFSLVACSLIHNALYDELWCCATYFLTS